MFLFQFCSFDSTTAPLIEGPPSEPISNDLQVHFAQTGHYLLPQTSEIEYHQAPESMKDFKDFVMTLRRNSDKRFYYKVAYDDFHNNGPFDGDMAFIIIEAVVLIVTGSAVAFIAWFITESKVSMLLVLLIDSRCTCAVRVMVLGLCVCL